MTNNMQKIHSLLGIAMRAGKLVSGEDGTMIDLKKGKLNLVIVAEDASVNTKEKFSRIAEQNHIKIYFYGTIDELSHQVGKNNKAVYGVMEQNFAKKMNQLFEEAKGAIC